MRNRHLMAATPQEHQRAPEQQRRPRDRDQRTPDDISARQRKRQAKLARRAAKHAAEQQAAKDGA